ncbi:hypothetical protein ACFP1I_32405 [Dyadobacter subterraneus]|uniref:DUF1772 domain-containing protein n=1 Tax=Dyadobacter subterraneus TaxID=2773304 RepID=A0ABR9WE01_9BACT|nr:hypothetical protein [Dyadobacter subterraneus]MBE9463724.1 hypothetical protein [Dyadobacter subterraneus]
MELTETVNLFFAGILTGLEIAAHYGFRGPASVLEERPQIQLRQGLVRKLRWLVPLFFVPTVLTATALAVLSTNMITLALRLIALAALAVWIYIRIIGTVKINAATLDWNPDRPPSDWRQQINKAEQFHIAGTWLTVVAWICFLLSASNIF